jgi:predicted nuclease of restriction endonuclease-like (RecB) superfamily
LQSEFPEIKGFTRSNLFYCKQFYQFYSIAEIIQQPVGQILNQPMEKLQTFEKQEIAIRQQSVAQFMQSPVAQIPWGHNILIFTKSKDIKEAMFYVGQTIENGWSRETLASQIKNDLYGRQGKAISNFAKTLPDVQSALVQQTLKDPYTFDFMLFDTEYRERDIENQLVANVNKFLLELGKGFAYIGQQYHLLVGENDYYIDLLFYHTRLKCYVVIELKNTKFIPEYAGKLNFYLSAVDSLLKQEDDKPTIGLLLCRSKNNIEAEFALRDINKPIGVSEFEITNQLPENLKSSLPTIEEIENELNRYEQ